MFDSSRALPLLLALSLVAVGATLAAGQAERAATAAETEGVVRSAEMDTYTRVGKPMLGGNRYYDPNVTYTYRVGGVQYVGRDVALGDDLETNVRSRATRVLARYESGATVTVHYDPANPEDSYLVPRYDFFPAGVAVVGGLALFARTLTPRTRVVDAVTSRLPGRDGRAPWHTEGTPAAVPSDPTAVSNESGSDGDATAEGAPVSGESAVVLWAGCALLALGVVALYVDVSVPPYDRAALLTGVAVVVAGARFGYRRVS